MSCSNIQSFNIISATVTAGSLVLTLSGTPTLTDRSQVVLKFAQNIVVPAGASALPTVIEIDATEYPLLDRFGNPMLGGELLTNTNGTYYSSRFKYLSYVGTEDTTHFITHNFPLKTCEYFVF